MEIETRPEGDKLTIAVSGRIDTVTAPELESSFQFGDAACVVLDLANVEYMSSAGLRLLLIAHKTMQGKDGKFLIANARPAVKEVLDITGFSGILNLV
jgi:anti-sigma B factor antagonist